MKNDNIKNEVPRFEFEYIPRQILRIQPEAVLYF